MKFDELLINIIHEDSYTKGMALRKTRENILEDKNYWLKVEVSTMRVNSYCFPISTMCSVLLVERIALLKPHCTAHWIATTIFCLVNRTNTFL